MTAYDEIMLKHDRAHEHLRRLQAEQRQYFDSKPFRVEIVPGESGNQFDFVIRDLQPVPAGLSLTIGDVVHNGRSVLDHLAHHLSLDPGEKPSFPIKLRRTGASPKIAGGTSPGVTAILEAVQPYNDEEPLENLLHILHQLDITDKHKLVLTTVTAPEGAAHSIMEAINSEADLIYDWDAFSEGHRFATITLPRAPDHFEPNFIPHAYVGIEAVESLNVRAPAVNLLGRILGEVAQTVNQFKPYLRY